VGMTSWLLRHTPPRPLVLASPGGTGARLAVERYAREHGWRLALNPAEANMLVVAGEGLEPYATRVWQAVPAPRVRVDAVEGMAVAAELSAAAGLLLDVNEQRKQAGTRHTPIAQEHADSGHDATVDHGEHSGHGGHDHHMAGMELPGGVPMADRAPDRDGLMLDQLHVPLGPALPLWPPGLVVHTTLQGDVIQDATVELLGAETFWAPHPVARRLDACACLLALAGWTDAAVTAQRLRDAALDGDLPEAPHEKWTARVRRSRTLRWLLTGLGRTPAGDALDRLHHWLGLTTELHETPVDDLPALLEGTELGTARLIVASLDLAARNSLAPGTHHG
jgi:hypothetical protein